MKQIQMQFTDVVSFQKDLDHIASLAHNNPNAKILFHIFSEILDEIRIQQIMDLIHGSLPEALVVGTSTNGNIHKGCLSEYCISMTATLFEDKDTQIEVYHFPFSEEAEEESISRILQIIEDRPWVKAVEMLLTIRGLSMTNLCRKLNHIRPEVCLFGGGAFSADINVQDALVFSSQAGISGKGILFILMGGDSFHVHTDYITGWKPLGRKLRVTDSEGPLLKTVEGMPAYDIYYRYLKIGKDQDFFKNTLEFPFMFQHHGIDLLRAPTACLDDGSLVMTADLAIDEEVQIAYGSPYDILTEVRKKAEIVQRFDPQVVLMFSCAARKFYWNGKADNETGPFQRMASTSGFYTSGEFLRTKGYVNQHNVTLVIAAMREGKSQKKDFPPVYLKNALENGEISMINRLANFITASTEELRQANDKLWLQSMLDGLTGLLNRKEIQHRLNVACDLYNAESDDIYRCSCIMLDIDNFKRINDQYGHAEGDRVLKSLSAILKNKVESHTIGRPDYSLLCEMIMVNLSNRTITNTFHGTGSVGRWGGEEFMIVLPGETIEEAMELAEEIRIAFSETCFEKSGHHSASFGVAKLYRCEDADSFIGRADKALYRAKEQGKNRVCI